LSRPLLERRGNYEHKTQRQNAHTQTNFFESFLVAELVDHVWLQQAAIEGNHMLIEKSKSGS
jgi:hypothetical protein